MAQPISIIKESWAGGEVSPELYSRVSLAKWGSWLKTAKNVFVQSSGAISNDPGTHYMATAKFDGKKIRMRKFVFSTLQAYELELGEYYIRFFTVGTNAGQIQKYTTWAANTSYVTTDFILHSGTYYRCKTANSDATFTVAKWDSTSWVSAGPYVVGDYVTYSGVMYYCSTANTDATWTVGHWTAQTILEIPTPYAEADLKWLKFTQSADVMFIASPDYAPRELSRLSNTIWTLSLYDFTGGPFQLQNTDSSILMNISAVTGLAKTLTASAKAWVTATVYQVGDYTTESATVYQCPVKHTSDTFATDLSAGKWVAATLTVFHSTHVGALFQIRHYVGGTSSTGSQIACGGTWRVISHGTWTATWNIEKSTDLGVTWTVIRTFSGAADFNVDTYGTEDMSNNADPFLVRVNVTSGSTNVELTCDAFYQEGIAKVTAYTSATAVTADVVRNFGSTGAVADWSEGSWSDYRGWPSVVEFQPQDRLMWANNYNEPQTFWATKTGEYYNFSRSNPLVDNDGITVNLPSREVNGINNLVALTSLLALTSASEWSIGDPGTVLTPTTTDQRINGYEGANYTDAVVVGNRAIFATSMGSTVRDLGYELSSYSFTGADLSVLAYHLFYGYTLLELDYQKFPYRLVYAVRSDGKLLTMTYMREQEILAWTWHDTNDGDDSYESVSCVPADGYDEVWFSVKRGTKRYIERQHNRLASNVLADQFFVHSGITYDSTPATVITGLDHLAGKTVAILADGIEVAQQTVEHSGSDYQITLATAASKVHIGLPYTSDIETLDVELNTQRGTSQGRKIAQSQFVLRLINSKGGYIGHDSSEMYLLRDNFVTDYDTNSTLYTGDIKDTVAGGYSDGGSILIRQTSPLPLTVAALILKTTIGGVTGT